MVTNELNLRDPLVPDERSCVVGCSLRITAVVSVFWSWEYRGTFCTTQSIGPPLGHPSLKGMLESG